MFRSVSLGAPSRRPIEIPTSGGWLVMALKYEKGATLKAPPSPTVETNAIGRGTMTPIMKRYIAAEEICWGSMITSRSLSEAATACSVTRAPQLLSTALQRRVAPRTRAASPSAPAALGPRQRHQLAVHQREHRAEGPALVAPPPSAACVTRGGVGEVILVEDAAHVTRRRFG